MPLLVTVSRKGKRGACRHLAKMWPEGTIADCRLFFLSKSNLHSRIRAQIGGENNIADNIYRSGKLR